MICKARKRRTGAADGHSERRVVFKTCSAGPMKIARVARETESRQRVRSLWKTHIQRLVRTDPEFFLSDEAKLLRTSDLWKGKTYQGLGATFENCLSLRVLHYVYFRPKEIEGISDEDGFQRMSLTASQFLRLCVARSGCSKDDVWKLDTLFNQVANLGLVRCFVEYALVCLQPSTAMKKVNHLVLIQEICSSFTNCAREQGSRHHISLYLRQTLKALKAASVRVTSFSVPQTLDSAELHACQRVARMVLTKIIEWYRIRTANDGSLSSKEQTHLVREWFSRFIPLLILCSGGQKPQILSRVEIPPLAEFEKRLRLGQSDGFLRLPTRCGRTQALIPPTVIFPGSSFPFLRFHVRCVNRIIYSWARYHGNDVSGPLLVNAKDGGFVKSSSIAYALRSFVCRVCPEKENVSPTSIIRSSLLLFIQSYRQRDGFRHITESEFFEALARKHNTTVRQIRVWIGHSNCPEYAATAKELSTVLHTFVGLSGRRRKHSMRDPNNGDIWARKRQRLAGGRRREWGVDVNYRSRYRICEG